MLAAGKVKLLPVIVKPCAAHSFVNTILLVTFVAPFFKETLNLSDATSAAPKSCRLLTGLLKVKIALVELAFK